jgi:hypothetical protein
VTITSPRRRKATPYLPEELLNLRLWLTTRGANGPTIKSIPKALKSIDGTPVLVEGGVMTLHSRWDTHKKKPVFWIEFRPDLNPDGSKTPEAEAREKEAAEASAKIVEQAQRNVERVMRNEALKAVNPFGPNPTIVPPAGPNPFHPQRPPFQPGEPKFSAFDGLVADNAKKGENEDKGEQP